ncbi:MAG: hypothetical protein RLZZ458_449, partial [Planctomycetota bacterium]
MYLQGSFGVDCSDTPGFVKFPAVDEAVVAGSAFEIDPEEGLCDALSELDFDSLAGTDFASPANAVDVAAAGWSWRCDQFACELIEGLVCDEGIVEPATDLLSAAGDKAGAAVVIAEQVIEECEPVIGPDDGVTDELFGEQ